MKQCRNGRREGGVRLQPAERRARGGAISIRDICAQSPERGGHRQPALLFIPGLRPSDYRGTVSDGGLDPARVDRRRYAAQMVGSIVLANSSDTVTRG